MSDIPYVLHFENEETKRATMVFARPVDTPLKPALPLTFTSGLRADLISVATSMGNYELSIGSVVSPRKGAVLALSPSK